MQLFCEILKSDKSKEYQKKQNNWNISKPIFDTKLAENLKKTENFSENFFQEVIEF